MSFERSDSWNQPDQNSPELNKYFSDNVFLTELWHNNEFFSHPDEDSTKSTWRSKERMKTSGAALVLCLNIGTDPPGIVKPNPCARKECWLEPVANAKQKSLEIIGNALQQQYEKWHPKAKYKQSLDPSPEDLRRTCINLRKTAKNDRLLLHYNGHGVPAPTKNGELWVFFKNYTHYMPVTAMELKSWLGEPAMFVIDCSGAGTLIPHFVEIAVEPSQPNQTNHSSSNSSNSALSPHPNLNLEGQISNELNTFGHSDHATIVLAACRSNEILPLNPHYPADVFTACLTTPISIAIRWLILQNPYSMVDISPEFVDNIPGKDSDRKSPRGELSWIFTTITDTIAWNSLPLPMFQKLFRQDNFVASLFRNFLLSKRIMKSLNCTPQSWPPLPDSSTHHLWQAWDLAAESCVLHAHALQKGSAMIDYKNNMPLPPFTSTASTSFFSDHLTAFEVWLDFDASPTSTEIPTYLPILLQMLLSPTHRLRALQLLRRYLSMGSYAVNLGLLVGIFPYVLKLLQNQASDIRQALLCIWTTIVGFDRTCRTELIREKFQGCFVQYLTSKDLHYNHRCMAAFTLAEICNGHPDGRQSCIALQLPELCNTIMLTEDLESTPDFKKWICLCLSKLYEDTPSVKYRALMEIDMKPYLKLLMDADPCVRAAAVVMLGNIFGAVPANNVGTHSSDPPSSTASTVANGFGNMHSQLSQSTSMEPAIESTIEEEVVLAINLLSCCTDGSVMVRREAVLSLIKFANEAFHAECFKVIAKGIRQLIDPHKSPEGVAIYDSNMNYPTYYHLYPWNLTTTQIDSITNMLQIYIDDTGFGAFPDQPVFTDAPFMSTALSPGRIKGIPSTQRFTPSPALHESSTRISSGTNNVAPSNTNFIGTIKEFPSLTPNSSSESLSHSYDHFDIQSYSSKTSTPHLPSEYKPESLHNNREKNSNEFRHSFVLATHYVRLWLAIQEIYSKDPHPAVKSSSAALTSGISKAIDAEAIRINNSSPFLGLHTINESMVSSNIPAPLQHHVTSPPTNPETGMRKFMLMHKSNSDSVLQTRYQTSHHIVHSGQESTLFSNQNPSPKSPLVPQRSPFSVMRSSRSEKDADNANITINRNQSPDLGNDAGTSHFYDWNRKLFLLPDPGYDPAEDPLSPEGQARIYRDHQLTEVRIACQKLSEQLKHGEDRREYFLDRKPSISHHDDVQSFHSGYSARASQPTATATASSVPEQSPNIKFEQQLLITNKSATKTSIVLFHAFQDILVSTDGHTISIWSLATSSRIQHFHNRNQNKYPYNAVQGKPNIRQSLTPSPLLPTASASVTGINNSLNSSNLNMSSHGQMTGFQDPAVPVATPEARITSMTWVNEAYDALLMVGSDDGTIKLWRDSAGSDPVTPDSGGGMTSAISAATNGSNVSLASSFVALPDIAETTKGSGIVTSWLQHTGTLLVGGNSSSIHLWDISREQCVRTFTTGLETCTTVLASISANPSYTLSYPLSHRYKAPAGNEDDLNGIPLTWCFAGFADGSVGVFDERVPAQGGRVHLSREHESWVISAHLRSDVPELITASVKGTVKFSDLRSMRSFKMLEIQKSPLSAFAVHPCAPILASGSQAQFVKALTFHGDQLGSIIKYHEGFLGQRIGPVLSLAFHPFRLQLAAGAADNVISVYQGVSER